MKKLSLALVVLFISCQSNDHSEFEKGIISEKKKTDIPAVVMVEFTNQVKWTFIPRSSNWMGDTINKNNIFRIAL